MLVYCSLVRSVVESASPVWAALPIYLQDMLEAVQIKALYIIFCKMEYKEAMEKNAILLYHNLIFVLH